MILFWLPLTLLNACCTRQLKSQGSRIDFIAPINRSNQPSCNQKWKRVFKDCAQILKKEKASLMSGKFWHTLRPVPLRMHWEDTHFSRIVVPNDHFDRTWHHDAGKTCFADYPSLLVELSHRCTLHHWKSGSYGRNAFATRVWSISINHSVLAYIMMCLMPRSLKRFR